MTTEQQIVELVNRTFNGGRLVAVELAQAGITLVFETAEEARGTLTVTGQLRTTMQAGQITVAPSVNVHLMGPKP